MAMIMAILAIIMAIIMAIILAIIGNHKGILMARMAMIMVINKWQ